MEKDTYLWTKPGEKDPKIKKGRVNTDSIYVYDAVSGWRAATANEADGYLLTEAGLPEKGKEDVPVQGRSGKWYVYSKSDKKWNEVPEEQVDTYGWTAPSGDEPVVKKGNVSDNYYVYDEKISTAAWRKAESELEYDTWGWAAPAATDPLFKKGVVTDKYYVYDADATPATWRIASALEKQFNNVCVTANINDRYSYEIEDTETPNAVYKCTADGWVFEKNDRFGRLTDSRDHHVYNTIRIGSQVWMAENLNFSDSMTYENLKGNNWCYRDDDDECTTLGRYYSWSAAINKSAAECGYDQACSLPTGDVQGICPDGWHLPSDAEFKTLIVNASEGDLTTYSISNSVGTKLKAPGWTAYEGVPDGSNTSGFSAKGAGVKCKLTPYACSAGNYGKGSFALFWSSTIYSLQTSYSMRLDNKENNAAVGFYSRNYGNSVRCVQNATTNP